MAASDSTAGNPGHLGQKDILTIRSEYSGYTGRKIGSYRPTCRYLLDASDPTFYYFPI